MKIKDFLPCMLIKNAEAGLGLDLICALAPRYSESFPIWMSFSFFVTVGLEEDEALAHTELKISAESNGAAIDVQEKRREHTPLEEGGHVYVIHSQLRIPSSGKFRVTASLSRDGIVHDESQWTLGAIQAPPRS